MIPPLLILFSYPHCTISHLISSALLSKKSMKQICSMLTIHSLVKPINARTISVPFTHFFMNEPLLFKIVTLDYIPSIQKEL